jgi:riboflavin kinase/FMN adenylyltransferase
MMGGRTVVTIGNFDGVHVGHRELVRAAVRLAREHERREGLKEGATRVVAMAFDPHPASVLRPGAEPERLTAWGMRRRLLRHCGADEVVRLEPTADLLGLTAEEFVGRLAQQWRPVAVVEGADFRFGKGRAGDVGLLRRLGRERAEGERFAVHVVEPVEVALGDQSIVRVSSTIARWLVGHGRMGDAARVLGRAYAVEGEVVRGDRRGRTLGFPTANVAAGSMLPADGVYAGVARVIAADGVEAGVAVDRPSPQPSPRSSEQERGEGAGRAFLAAVSVGTKPQFRPGETGRTLEAHLLDVERDGEAIATLPEYGWRVEIEFVAWLRDQQRFDGVDALVAQIGRDCERVREVIERAGTLPEAVLDGFVNAAEGPGCR